MISPLLRCGLRLALLLGLLAACGPALTPQPTPPPSSPAATASPSPAPPRPTAAPPVTALPQATATPRALTLWAVGDLAQAESLQRLLADLGRATGVELAVVVKSPDGLHADMRADALAGHPPPDLIWGTQEDLGLLQRAGVLLPADDGLPEDAFIPATIAGSQLDHQRWGTPVAAAGYLLLFYNKRLVGTAPTTTDELIVQSRALTRGGTYGLVAGWAEPRWLVAWLTGMGGGLINPDDSPTLDTPQMVSALNLLKELRAAGPPAPSTYNQGAARFRQGQAAFSVDGDWALGRYRESPETLDLGIGRMPVVPGTGRVAAPPLNGVYLMYSKALEGDRRSQARALATALTSAEAQSRIAHELALLPALKTALNDPAVQQDPILAAAAAQLDGAAGLPATRGLRCAWNAIRAQLPAVLLDEQAPTDAATRMQSDALACVAG